MEKSAHFIGRRQEIQLFNDWLESSSSPWILYFSDATEEKEKKGGIGKTWLLRHCAEIVTQDHPNIAVLMVDFFNVEERDGLFLAEKVAQEFHRSCPEWDYTAFDNALKEYTSEKSEEIAEDETTFTALAAALVEDIERLESILEQQQKVLLVFFDTFETIENNPIVAVLRRSQTFPDNYSSSHMKVVM